MFQTRRMEFEDLPNPLEAAGQARDWTEHQAARVLPGVVGTAADVYSAGRVAGDYLGDAAHLAWDMGGAAVDVAGNTVGGAVDWGERQLAGATTRAVDTAADVFSWLAD